MAPWRCLSRERERKVVLVALMGDSAGNMAVLQSQACFKATTSTTITLILKGDPVPEDSSPWCIYADGTFPQVPLVCVPDSDGKHAASEDNPPSQEAICLDYIVLQCVKSPHTFPCLSSLHTPLRGTC